MNITKGRWYSVENDYYVDIKVDGNPIAQVIENEFVDTDKDTMRANAKLIECAPEMYGLINDLRNAISIGGLGCGINDTEALKTIDKLLAKARGES